MTLEHVLVDVEDHLALVKINRPQALNALSDAVLAELNEIIADLEKRDDVSVVILTGEGKAFVAGADIAEMSAMTPEAARRFGEAGSRVFRRLETLRVPVIAAVNGYALGGGCELALACDIRIASDRASFGQPEVGLGIIPGFSGTQRLPRLIGVSRAKELLYTGAQVKAAEALAMGLVSKVVAPEDLMPTCMELARKIASNAKLAVGYAKMAVNHGIEAGMEAGMALEHGLFGLCFASADQKEGMTAFAEKRRPGFIGA